MKPPRKRRLPKDLHYKTQTITLKGYVPNQTKQVTARVYPTLGLAVHPSWAGLLPWAVTHLHSQLRVGPTFSSRVRATAYMLEMSRYLDFNQPMDRVLLDAVHKHVTPAFRLAIANRFRLPKGTQT